MNQYRNSWSAFRNKLSTLLFHIDGDDKTICRMRVQVDEVNVDDIDIDKVREDYKKLVNYTSYLALPIVVINRILLRYCKLLTEFDEKSVKTILNQIVTEAITSELQEMIHDRMKMDIKSYRIFIKMLIIMILTQPDSYV